MEDRIHGVNPAAILVEDEVWEWSNTKVVKDIVVLATFYGDANNRGLIYTPKQGEEKDDVDTAMVLMIPVGIIEWMLTTPRTPWGLHENK